MPFPSEPCQACPRVGRGLPTPCRAQTTGHARFCELAAAGHEGYVALLCDDLPPPSMPPLLARVRNLAGAVVQAVKSRAQEASPAERARRLDICRGCENYDGGSCRLCGCHLPLKVRLEAWHCPLDPPKW